MIFQKIIFMIRIMIFIKNVINTCKKCKSYGNITNNNCEECNNDFNFINDNF